MHLCRESKIVASLCVADLISTLVFVRGHGATEANMVMRFYLQYGLVAFIGAKCLLFLPALLIAEWYRHRNPRLITGTLRLVILLYVSLYGMGVYTLNRDRLAGGRFHTEWTEHRLNQPAVPPLLPPVSEASLR
jgi:hypothetical protein